jgi:DNA (cytosine-5)-methyltransferase 1
MRLLDLFSGIGGFSLGLERAGMQTTAFCEIDPYCRKVLAKHWPGVKIHDDVKQLDGNQYAGAVDVICGGYPCQPFSAAGKQQGEKDPRHLWPEMRRIIREARPRWVIAENVRGHVSLGFDAVASQLEDDGFTVWPFLVPACAVGAPHRRDRLWIVAYASRPGRQQVSGSPSCHEGANAGRQAKSDYEPKCDGQSCGTWNVAHSHSQSQIGPAIARQECHSWAIEPAVGRVAHGVSKRLDRVRSLGNAVVPQIPELFGRSIMVYEQQRMRAA